DTNSAADRGALQAEYDELGKELNNIMTNTSYAGEKLFSANGAAGKFAADIKFQIGATSGETLSLSASGAVSGLATALSGVVATFADATLTSGGTEIESQAGANGKIQA